MGEKIKNSKVSALERQETHPVRVHAHTFSFMQLCKEAW